MQRRSFLPTLALLAVATGCGGGNDSTYFPPPDDGAVDASGPVDASMDDTVVIGTDVQSFDIQPVDTGSNPPPPTDSGVTPPPTDTGTTTSGGGVCPSACAVSTDCDPCWHTGEARMGNNYCCVSGLCIFRTGTCDSVPPPTDAGGGGGGGGDAGLDAGGGGGLDAGGGGGGGGDAAGADGG